MVNVLRLAGISVFGLTPSGRVALKTRHDEQSYGFQSRHTIQRVPPKNPERRERREAGAEKTGAQMHSDTGL